MGRIVPCFAASIAALFAPTGAAALEIADLWTVRAEMTLENAPVAADLDGDGADEMVIAGYFALIALNGDGTERWRLPARGRYGTCPAVLERDGQPALIFAGDNTGHFRCVDGAGKVVWEADTDPAFCASPAAADLDGDGLFEVVQGLKSGAVIALDAASGEVRWTRQLTGECSSPAIADLDGDGTAEVVIATGAGMLYVLDEAGAIRWEIATDTATPDWATASPIVFRARDGAMRILWATGAQRIGCWNANGDLLWDGPTRGAVASALSAGDFDGDGAADLFAVTQLGVVHRFDEDGGERWAVDTQSRGLAPGALADLDGDGALEFTVCAQQGSMIALNQSAEIVYSRQFESRTINMTPAFGDFDPKRPGLEFAVTGGESGRVHLLAANAAADGAWTAYRGDGRGTAAWNGGAAEAGPVMYPETLAWHSLRMGEPVVFTVRNPSPGLDALVASARYVAPDGRVESAAGRIIGAEGILHLPVAAVAPGAYQFDWALRDAAGTTLSEGARSVTVEPFAADMALYERADQAVSAFLGDADSATDAERAMRGGQRAVHLELNQARRAAFDAQRMLPAGDAEAVRAAMAQSASLNAMAHRALALASAVYQTLQGNPSAPLAVFEGSTWDNRAVDRAVPETVQAPLAVYRRAVPGEHEPVSLKILNLGYRELEVRCRAIAHGEDVRVELLTSKAIPANLGETAWDALVPLENGLIAIPSREARELWLDIDLRDAQPGTHTVDLTFAGGGGAVDASVTIEVLPFDMAGFGALRLCPWARYTGDAVADLLDHGANVFIAPSPPASAAPAFEALGAFVAPLTEHDVFLLLNGVPDMGVPKDDAAYGERLKTYLDAVYAFLESKGFPADRVAFYPYDEPGIHGAHTVDSLVAFGRRAKAARPGLQIYVNGPADLPTLTKLDEVTDIWAPFYHVLDDRTPEMDLIRNGGKALWSYDCSYIFARPIGPNTKTINIPSTYRLAPLLASGLGAGGVGYWCYNHGDPIWDAAPFEYPLVYANPDGTHTASRRWKAVREGMEDARLYIALRERLADPSIDAETRAALTKAVEDIVPVFARDSLTHGRIGSAGYQIGHAHNDATVARLRETLLDAAALASK